MAEIAETATSEPHLLFLPTAPVRAGSNSATLQFRNMQDGRRALLAYTSLELLVAGCGRQQAWIAAPASSIEDLQQRTGFDLIALNVLLPDDMRVAVQATDAEMGEPHG